MGRSATSNHPLIAEIRQLARELREAEFKAGVVHKDLDLAERKNKIASDLDARLQGSLQAVEDLLLTASINPAAEAAVV